MGERAGYGEKEVNGMAKEMDIFEFGKMVEDMGYPSIEQYCNANCINIEDLPIKWDDDEDDE